MVRGTIHDLVQWIFTLENENAQLRQALEAVQKELADLKAKKE